METELVELRPSELKFVFELKKQSSCSVQLINKSVHHVAFKVKTTAPKKYCVRPNVGIVSPKNTCDFTVTMQAQKVAPSELQCKDKFLVQSIVVPVGTTEEGLHSNLFSKESGHYIEESKLRVVFISPPNSPDIQPINGSLNKESPVSQEPSLLNGNAALKEPPLFPKETLLKRQSLVTEDIAIEKISPVKNSSVEFKLNKVAEANGSETMVAKVSRLESKLKEVAKANGTENVAAKVAILESKLKEAEKTIARLREEHDSVALHKSKLQQEAVLLRRRAAASGQVGFPFLFVCFVALVALTVGYLVHS